MTKQQLYDLSTQYRANWQQLANSVQPLLLSPITGFSSLVDYSAHGLNCPKANQVYKLYLLSKPAGNELTQLRALRDMVDQWIKLLEEGVE